ncbi:MAG: VWA domain-containing protein [Bacteriovoracaceae bacterium]|nr:VWA domain-containing protein [Bacteriovoracaceae bacterium]
MVDQGLQFKHPYLMALGLLWLIAWSTDFWMLGIQTPFSIPKSFASQYKNKFRNFRFLKWIIFFAGVIGIGHMTYALMGPRMPESFSRNEREVLDIFLVVDVSRSMLAEDVRPNRLEAAKNKLREFALLKPKDRIGLIIFSEKIFTLLPLTMDPSLVTKIIDDINIGFLGSGTNIGDALGLAVGRLQLTATKNKVIILLTDGVSNVGNLTPLQAADMAAKNKIKIYGIGLGTDKDARIPVGQGIFGMQYQNIPGGSIDHEGLRTMAKMTGGKSYEATSSEALENILREIDRLERTKQQDDDQVSFEELFAKYLIVGLLFYLAAEMAKWYVLREVA